MEIITTYQTPGLAPLLAMIVLVLLIRRTRRMWHRPGYGLTAALRAVSWPLNVAVSDRAAPLRRQGQSRSTHRRPNDLEYG